MVDITSRSPVTCICGRTVQKKNLAQHCASKTHTTYAVKQRLTVTEENDDKENDDLPDIAFDLTAFLREHDIRSDPKRIQAIATQRKNMDPYTKIELKMENDELILDNFDVDHIHEAQILACAVLHTSELAPRIRNTLVLKPLRYVVNDVTNLAITEAKVNRSKGQAVKYFLGYFKKSRELPLLSAFIQTANGKERSIAHFAQNIVQTIQATSSDMSDSIRQIRMDNGQITGSSAYEKVAEEFDTIIDKMQLNWNEGVKLRNGKTYYVSK